MNLKKQFTEGLITNNPVLVQRIGLCSTMAITTMFFNGIGMGLSVLIILTCCNVVISAMRKVIPNDIRLAMFVVVNTASIQLIPATTAMLRMQAGSAAPLDILPATWIASVGSVAVGIVMAGLLAPLWRKRP